MCECVYIHIWECVCTSEYWESMAILKQGLDRVSVGELLVREMTVHSDLMVPTELRGYTFSETGPGGLCFFLWHNRGCLRSSVSCWDG